MPPLTQEQIGDLLAQINGDASSNKSSSASNSRRSDKPSDSIPAKRKHEGDLRDDASKAPRTATHLQNPGSHQIRPTSAKQSALQRPMTASGVKSHSAPSTNHAAPSLQSSMSSARGRPILNSASHSTACSSKMPPKKGSFAEIMARGQRAQATMGQVGKINHKKAEKAAIKKKEGRKLSSQERKSHAGTNDKGNSKPLPRSNLKENGFSKHDIQPLPTPPTTVVTGKRTLEQASADKKMRAAQASTVYTGTARPKPGNTAKNDAPRGGALLNTPVARRGSSKRSCYKDEYDEDLDDFIEYDDASDQGPRYDYDSDGSSDMEAGLDELDSEERRAEYLARQEDIEEERLEKSLKAAKENRRRKAFDVLRDGKRR